MSPWDDFARFRTGPKKPPPEHGIKVKKTGSTWWGQRWIEALERMSSGYSNRLERGRTYARAGRTHDLIVKKGQISARVTGSRSEPYRVTLRLATLSDEIWKEALAAMAEKAQFTAALVAGEMPKDIDDAFHRGGASLFPASETDLVTDCSCPDWANPCKHVAATHYVLGEALDRDPFLLFELRGRTREQVLDALRAARAGHSSSARGSGGAERSPVTNVEPEIPKVTLGKLTHASYDQPREVLPKFHLSFDEPVVHGAILRQLGAPAAWNGKTSPVELLAPLVRAAAEKARRIALSENTEDLPEPKGTAEPKRTAVPETAEPKGTARRKKTKRR